MVRPGGRGMDFTAATVPRRGAAVQSRPRELLPASPRPYPTQSDSSAAASRSSGRMVSTISAAEMREACAPMLSAA